MSAQRQHNAEPRQQNARHFFNAKNPLPQHPFRPFIANSHSNDNVPDEYDPHHPQRIQDADFQTRFDRNHGREEGQIEYGILRVQNGRQKSNAELSAYARHVQRHFRVTRVKRPWWGTQEHDADVYQVTPAEKSKDRHQTAHLPDRLQSQHGDDEIDAFGRRDARTDTDRIPKRQPKGGL